MVGDDSRTEVRRDELVVRRGLAKLDLGVARHGGVPGDDHIGAGQGLLRDRRNDRAEILGWRDDDGDILAGRELAIARGQPQQVKSFEREAHGSNQGGRAREGDCAGAVNHRPRRREQARWIGQAVVRG